MTKLRTFPTSVIHDVDVQVYLDNIVERIPYYVFWKDANCVYLGCNQRFATLVGKKTPKEVVGKTDFDLPWGEGEAEAFVQGDKNAMTGNPQVNAEEFLLRPDGSKIELSAYLLLIYPG